MNRLPFFIVLGALVPYLTDVIRAEYILIPMVSVLSILTARRFNVVSIWAVLGLVFALIALVVASVYSSQTGFFASPFNSFVRLLMPTLMIFSFPLIMNLVDRPLDRAASAIVILSAISALFTITSMQSPFIGNLITSWVRAEGGFSVWSASYDIGRYNGVFNQPLEAGTFYSVALLALVYSWKRASTARWLLALALILVIIGGAASFSKNFLVVGFILTIGLAIWTGTISIGRILIIIIPIVIISGFYILQSNFLYFNSLSNIYYSDGLLSALSAGRYGGYQSEVSWLFTETWNSKFFLLGHGLGAYLPLDSGYLEFFYQGGFLALIGYVIFLFALTLLAWNHRDSDAGKLLFTIMLYIIGSSFGGPVISAARANVPLMLLISASLVALKLPVRPTNIFDQERDCQPIQIPQKSL